MVMNRYVIWEHNGFCQIVDMEDETTYGCFTNVESLELVCNLLNEKQNEIYMQRDIINDFIYKNKEDNDNLSKKLLRG